MRANDTTPLVVINQVAPIYVSFSVPGRYLPEIRRYQAQQPLVDRSAHPGQGRTWGAAGGAAGPGSRASADGAPTVADRRAPATTRERARSPSSTTASIRRPARSRLKGTFANDDQALWPGLFVQVTLVLRPNPNAIVVPAAAVQASQAGQFVFVVKPDRTAEVRNVTVERQQGEEIVVAQGPAAGEEVVTDGQLRLTPARASRRARAARVRQAGGGARPRGTGRGRRGRTSRRRTPRRERGNQS